MNLTQDDLLSLMESLILSIEQARKTGDTIRERRLSALWDKIHNEYLLSQEYRQR